MSSTSTASKRKYNEKTYKRWYADIKIKEFEQIEILRGNMSRAEFLKMLITKFLSENDKAGDK